MSITMSLDSSVLSTLVEALLGGDILEGYELQNGEGESYIAFNILDSLSGDEDDGVSYYDFEYDDDSHAGYCLHCGVDSVAHDGLCADCLAEEERAEEDEHACVECGYPWQAGHQEWCSKAKWEKVVLSNEEEDLPF